MLRSEALALLERVLGCTRAEAAVASLRGSVEQSLRLADNRFTDNMVRTSLHLQLEVAFGNRRGSALTSQCDERSLRRLVECAEAAAKNAPPDPEYLPPLGAQETARYAAPLGDAPPPLPDIARRGADLSAAAQQAAASGVRLSGALCDRSSWSAVAASTGLRAYHAAALSGTHVTAIAGDGTGWAQKISPQAAEVAPAEVAARAQQIAEAARQPREISPEPMTLIMSPAAVAELLVFLFWAGFDGKAADEGRSFLRDCLGQKIFSEHFTLRSHPAESRCPAWPFHSDGLAAPAVAWVERGVVKHYSDSRFWAQKTGRPITGPPTNLIVEGGSASLDDMIAATDRGLLATRFWYVRFVDPMAPTVTGMTRDGLFLVEKGRVVGPARHLRFNVNLREVFSRIAALGPAVRADENMPMLVPAIMVRDFRFTSATRF